MSLVRGRMSRLNFDKIYTMEHNLRILDIGEVYADSTDRYHDDFKDAGFIDCETSSPTRVFRSTEDK